MCHFAHRLIGASKPDGVLLLALRGGVAQGLSNFPRECFGAIRLLNEHYPGLKKHLDKQSTALNFRAVLDSCSRMVRAFRKEPNALSTMVHIAASY